MNKRVLTLSVLLPSMLMMFQNCGDKPEQQNVPEQKTAALNVENSGPFNESFTKLIESYYSLKDAFVTADTVKVNSAAAALSGISGGLRTEEIKGDTSGTIRETAKYFAGTISTSAVALSAEPKVEEKLREFNMITDALWSLTRTVKYEGQKVYYQFCSEAFDNTGAYWLSNKIDTDDPYIPGNAKTCSEVRDSLDYGKK